LSEVVRLCQGIKRIIPFPRKKLSSPKAVMSFVKELRAEDYDVAIDYQGLLRSGIMTALCKAEKKAGFSHAREGAPLFYGKRCVITDLHSHAVDKNIILTRFALDIPESITVPPPEISLSRESIQEMDAIAPAMHDSPVLAVCFSSRWHSKNWSQDFIAKCLDETARRVSGLRVFLIGSPDDMPEGDRLTGLCRQIKPVNLAGRTSFPMLAALLSRSSAMLTVDSGPMHLAAAVGLPCVALFGATDDVLTGPYGASGLHRIIRSNCEQRPCFMRDCPKRANCADFASLEETTQAILEKLNRQHGGKL
ncbi:MAG: hypothetical protein IJS15_11250, partial [Victivallales bacterium]|nr:hypothetical protein [Victivallales bacterium]